jgi:hypothetical protein
MIFEEEERKRKRKKEKEMEQFLASASRDNRPAQRRAFVNDFGGTIHGLTGWDGFVGT